MKQYRRTSLILCLLLLIIGACISCTTNDTNNNESTNTNANDQRADSTDVPSFREVTVHDPSVIHAEDTFYVFGSHLASAKSDDLMNWEQISTEVHDGNPLIPNVMEEMSEAFEWAETDTFWAGYVIQLDDGRYYKYYSVCEGSSPRSAIGLAVADHPEGPYENKGIMLKSGMWNEPSEDGDIYDATVHPNTIDPHPFFDAEGNYWMVYGSYSGGIFILEMDPETGFPKPEQGYGKKLLGGHHSRIEAPHIMYNPDTEYYYLFLSFGGLDTNGGYNIRVARSEYPDGPYYDPQGNNLIDAHGEVGSFFDDEAIEPFGLKLIGNFRFQTVDGEQGRSTGYVSPGHNSAYYDADTDTYYTFFHTRFPLRGEAHEVRVHPLFFNEKGWPVLAPHRYAGETMNTYSTDDIIGEYKYINHGREITDAIQDSEIITLDDNGSISGSISGTWEKTGDASVKITTNTQTYHGVFIEQWDPGTHQHVMTFTAASNQGVSIWGSKVTPHDE